MGFDVRRKRLWMGGYMCSVCIVFEVDFGWE